MIFSSAQFLYGIFFATIPVIIHLIAKRKLKTFKFSSIMFLIKAAQKASRRYKIKDILLLILRVLIIVFLVLSISKPFLYKKNIKSNEAVLTNKRKSVVIIIDNSVSMGQIIEGEIIFKKAKRVAENIIKNYLKDGDNVSVILPSDKNPLKFIDLTYNFDNVLETIRNSDIGYLKADFFKALKMANSILNSSMSPVKIIYLITDMQKNNWADEEGNFLNKELKIDYPVFVINLKTKEVKNSAIVKTELSDVLSFKEESISIKGLVKNYGNDKCNLILKNYIMNEALAQRSLEILGNTTSSVQFDSILNYSGFIFGFSEILDGDELNYDNRNYFVMFVPENIKVLLTESKNEMFYVLNSLSPEYILTKKSSKNLIISVEKNFYFNPKFDIFVISKNDFEVGIYKTVKNILYSGKSIIIFLPLDLDINSFNNTFSKNNLLPGAILQKIEIDKNSPLNLEAVDYNHPALKIFENYKSLNLVNIYKYYKFNLQFSSLNFRSLAKFSNGDDAIIEYAPFQSEYPESGKIILFLFLPVPDSSDIVYRPSFPAFMHQIVKYLAFPNYIEKLNKFKVGQSIQEVKNILEIENSNIELKTLTDEKSIEGDTIVKPGIFKIGTKLFAVNIDFNESDLTSVDIDSLQKNYKNINFIFVNSEKDFETKILTGLYGKHYWKEFLFIALILLVLEMFLANNWKFFKIPNKI